MDVRGAMEPGHASRGPAVRYDPATGERLALGRSVRGHVAMDGRPQRTRATLALWCGRVARLSRRTNGNVVRNGSARAGPDLSLARRFGDREWHRAWSGVVVAREADAAVVRAHGRFGDEAHSRSDVARRHGGAAMGVH